LEGTAKECPVVNQSLPPARPPEGLEGSRRGERLIAGARDPDELSDLIDEAQVVGKDLFFFFGFLRKKAF
jgi:hypothetical protein